MALRLSAFKDSKIQGLMDSLRRFQSPPTGDLGDFFPQGDALRCCSKAFSLKWTALGFSLRKEILILRYRCDFIGISET
jgi:hypothetical protein